MKNTPVSNRHAAKALKSLLLTGIVSSPAVLHAADRTWDGATGPFGTDTNWSDDTVPGVGDNVFIDNGGTAQIGASESFTIDRLRLGTGSNEGNLTISGGTLTLVGGGHTTYIGGDDVNGGAGVGTVTISTGGALTGTGGGEMLIGSRGGVGTIHMTGGTLSNNNWIIFGRDAAGTGNANLSGNAQISKTGGNHIAIGIFSGTTSTITMTDTASMTSNNEIRLGWGNGVGTRGVLNMSGDSTAIAGSNFIVALRDGGSEAPTGELHMTGNATATANNEFWIGQQTGANGTLTMADTSTVNVTNGFVVGRSNAAGTAILGGSAEVNVGGFTVLGDGGSASANVTVNNSASINTTQMVWIGHNDSTATLTVNGGLITSHANLGADNTGAGIAFRGTSTLNLNGGIVETPGFNKTGSVAELNLNGGTIKATGDTNTGSFFNNFANGDIDIQVDGAIIDTNGHNITVVQDLSGIGGLTKEGSGSLTLTGSSSYLGATVISGGSLVLGDSHRIGDSSTLTLDGGTLDLNNFSEMFAALTLSSTSTIDFGALPGANAVIFADSSSIAWTGSLILENFDVGLDTLSFSGEDGLTPEQLDAILLDGYQATGFAGGSVIFTAIPEPAGAGLAITGMLFLLTAFRRKPAA